MGFNITRGWVVEYEKDHRCLGQCYLNQLWLVQFLLFFVTWISRVIWCRYKKEKNPPEFLLLNIISNHMKWLKYCAPATSQMDPNWEPLRCKRRPRNWYSATRNIPQKQLVLNHLESLSYRQRSYTPRVHSTRVGVTNLCGGDVHPLPSLTLPPIPLVHLAELWCNKSWD